jgi:hypothetical protein
MEQLKRDDLHIYINHLKPFYAEHIMQQLHEIGISKDAILKDGEKAVSLLVDILNREEKEKSLLKSLLDF